MSQLNMLTKRNWLLIGLLISLLIGASISFSYVGPCGDKGRIADEPFIEMTYFTGTDVPITSDVYWIKFKIETDGESEFIKFMRHAIFEAKAGNLTKEQLESLMDFIEVKGFYQLDDRYEHESGLQCDGGITTIVVNLEGEFKSVYTHCILAPDNFYDIQDRLIQTGRNLHHDLYGVFIQAEQLDTRRVMEIRENFEFIPLSGKLEEYPFIKEAIEEAAEFVHIGSWNNTKIDGLVLKGYDYFFIEVADRYYQIDVFVTK